MKPLTTKHPRTSLLNSDFRYFNSGETDVKRTFARIRREMKEAQVEAESKVTQLKRSVK